MAQTGGPKPASGESLQSVPKILRIGVKQGDRIIEERLIRKRESVSIGLSAKNTFVVPSSITLPKSFTLFGLTPKGYVLNFSEGMDGRVAIGEQVVPLPSLMKKSGKAAARAPGQTAPAEIWHVQLSEDARGKVVIGDVTVLFQFVVPPPVQPRPQLPPSVRSSLMQNLDWMFVSVIAASFVCHFGFVAFLSTVEMPKEIDIEEVPDRFVRMIVPPKIEEKRKEPEKPEEKIEPEPEQVEKKEKKRDPEAVARAAAAAEARRRKIIENTGVLKMLTSKKGQQGAVSDMLHNGDVSGDASKVFDKVSGVGVASASLTGRGTGGSGSLLAGGSLRAGTVGSVGTGDKGERAVRGLVKADTAPSDISGSYDPALIAKEIRRYLGGIKACYESGLKRNPAITGKLVVHFTISSVGKVTSAKIEDDSLRDVEVADCVKSRVGGWRFPAPEGGPVEVSYPFIFQAAH